ncbi:MAG: YeeE/YedE family protein [Leptolyngbyaceae cyanobacterium T60_A2020_046]|nr:YeeE/YedE family protein [Leptolyngbyaceae cyanobacterium T60_A2020_046]
MGHIHKQQVVALISGLIFGFGLGVSQMIDRDRVIGFLDVAGHWDPTLAFVMGGAVAVTLITFRVVLRQPRPLLASRFFLPTRNDIDRPLLIGAAIFGIGWGIAGYCPGPGLTALVLGLANPIIFVVAMIAGSLSWKAISDRAEKRQREGVKV